MEKFRGKYRIPSARRVTWDYGSNGAYFVTICVARRRHDFGEIAGEEMVASPLGQAAWDRWEEIPVHFPFVVLDAFVVMPNHVHGILIIAKSIGVETQNIASLRANRFGPQSQNLASIVRGYKIGVTKFARQNNLPFAWQSRYHDHVIRNTDEHERIREYIRSNPQHWVEDTFYGLGRGA
jgi:putative transposase